MKKKKLLFVTGSRGEWGYIRPILKKIEKSKFFQYKLCVTNMHLLPSFGESINEIKSDGFKVHYKINMSIDPNSPIELYNLSDDIGEKNNVAKNFPNIVSKMREIMDNEHLESEIFKFEFEKKVFFSIKFSLDV